MRSKARSSAAARRSADRRARRGFGALVEARTADHAIGQPERDEALLELAHLERGAHENGDFVERMALALLLLDVLADDAGFFFRIPDAADGRLTLAIDIVGEQRLAEAVLVVGDKVAAAARMCPVDR